MSAATPSGTIGLRTGIGIVIANMVGSGVFLSAGFMAQDLDPLWLMLSWVVGSALALIGARTYAEVASLIGRSGGEYRYLSDLLHPWLGSLAGWASLLIGFAASIAVDALSAGAFLKTLLPWIEPRWLGAALILILSLVHASRLDWSKWSQNALVIGKILLVVGFVAVGLTLGQHAWPTWTAPSRPPDGSFPLDAFLGHQYWVAFTFSGWNAAIYVAGEFRTARRDVPRAMLVGCAAVAVLYLLVNWVFVANLTPEQSAVVTTSETEAITLGHLVIQELLGPVGGAIMSGCAVLIFVSALSAMILVGPRVYAEMARDGVLPSWLIGAEGRPPTGSILLQAGLALGLLFGESLLELVQSAAIILLLFSGLTALAVLWIRWKRPDLPSPSLTGQICAAIYLLSVIVLMAWGLQASLLLGITLLVITLCATVAWWIAKRRAPPSAVASE
ncbi:MAG: amino acid permease [Deltaproteobacteria bacterium]|nr:MAG: amino acid permease [Deltaproteobacteria bacterium]